MSAVTSQSLSKTLTVIIGVGTGVGAVIYEITVTQYRKILYYFHILTIINHSLRPSDYNLSISPPPIKYSFLHLWLYLLTLKILHLLKLPYYQICVSKRECCHCICLQEIHLSTNLPQKHTTYCDWGFQQP